MCRYFYIWLFYIFSLFSGVWLFEIVIWACLKILPEKSVPLKHTQGGGASNCVTCSDGRCPSPSSAGGCCLPSWDLGTLRGCLVYSNRIKMQNRKSSKEASALLASNLGSSSGSVKMRGQSPSYLIYYYYFFFTFSAALGLSCSMQDLLVAACGI